MPELNKQFIDSITKSYKEFNELESMLSDRITEVLHTIAKVFNTKLDWWDWHNGGNDIDGHFTIDMVGNDEFYVHANFKNSSKMVAIVKDGEWGFAEGSFPTWFLFEDFEQPLIDGIALYKEREHKKTLKAVEDKKKKTQEKKSLIATAKSKLTPAERKALGIRS